MDPLSCKELGPLASLVGIWEGTKGDDTAPSDDRGTEKNYYRERVVFEPTGQVDNHEQVLFGLRYSMTAWRLNEDKSFHEEVGYWLWDAKAQQVMKCFVIPRGVSVLAGGTAQASDKTFSMAADVGAKIYGISSNPFLDVEFQTLRYELKVTVHEADSFTYEQDSHLLLKGQKEIFHHRDHNTLRRVQKFTAG